MTHAEALAEARRRWGPRADCERRLSGIPGFPDTFVVGTKGAMPQDVAYGKGDSYEAAFADADRRGATR